MATFDLNTLNSALRNSDQIAGGVDFISTDVDFSGKSLKLDTAKDAQPIVDAINSCPNLQYLTLTGNTLGVKAAEAISTALRVHPELKVARFSDMFTGRMKTEIPPALSALGEGMIAAGARLSVLDLSDNAFGPIGVEGLAKLLQSDVCSELEELRLNNNGLGITGGRLLAAALSARPRRLKTFIAGRNRLENDGAIALAKVFKSICTLEEVAMPQNGIYHVGITALSDAFKHNPNLARLNLNDNTVGIKGAAAIADALPKLPNLKSINFGDCLLKSQGGVTLAKAFKDNVMLIECVDLSHNEMGRAACMALAETLAAPPGRRERLTRIALHGNSLGGEANKRAMREKLGAAAELSDEGGSDDEYVTDTESEHSESEDGHSVKSEDSATEDAQQADTTVDLQDISIDDSVIEVETDVSRFLKNPSIENLNKLGSNAAEVIDTHLQAIKDPVEFIQAYVEATLLVSGLPENSAAPRLYPLLAARAQQRHALQWALADSVLRGLALIKSENKNYKIRWSLPECYTVLAGVIDAPYFPHSLRDTLRFFISSKLTSMPAELQEVVHKHPILHS